MGLQETATYTFDSEAYVYFEDPGNPARQSFLQHENGRVLGADVEQNLEYAGVDIDDFKSNLPKPQ